MATLGSRLILVTGESQRLRTAILDRLRAAWDGDIATISHDADADQVLLGLETPSMFSDRPTLWLWRVDETWLRRQREAMARHIGQAVVAGVLVLISDACPQDSAPTKAMLADLRSAGALLEAAAPSEREMPSWIAMQLTAHPQGVGEPHRIADILLRRLGADCDAILGAIDLIALACHPQRLDAEAADALVAGQAERPVWEFSGALLDGRDADALRMLHAPQAEPGALLNGLISELRRLLAVKQTTDDAEAARLAGVKATAAMNHARRRAARFKPDELRRLLAGAIQALRQARGRVDELTAAEWYVANAKRIVGARR